MSSSHPETGLAAQDGPVQTAPNASDSEHHVPRQANKGILIERIAHELDVPPRDAAEMLHVVLDAWRDLLRIHGKVALKGFGTFERRLRKARSYRHPVTGVSIAAPDRETILFKPSPQLLDSLG